MRSILIFGVLCVVWLAVEFRVASNALLDSAEDKTRLNVSQQISGNTCSSLQSDSTERKALGFQDQNENTKNLFDDERTPSSQTGNGPYESFVFVAPTESFVHQLVSIGLEMHDRGHRVTFVSHEGLRRKLRIQLETSGRNFRNQSLEIVEIGKESDWPSHLQKSNSVYVPERNIDNNSFVKSFENRDQTPSTYDLLVQLEEESPLSTRWSSIKQFLLLWNKAGYLIRTTIKTSTIWFVNLLMMNRKSPLENHGAISNAWMTRVGIETVMEMYDKAFEAILEPFEQLLLVQQKTVSPLDSGYSKLHHCYNTGSENLLYNARKPYCLPHFSSSLFVIPGPWDFALRFCRKHELPHVLTLSTPLFANIYSYPIYAPPLYSGKAMSVSQILRFLRQPPTFIHRLSNMFWNVIQVLQGSIIPGISSDLYRSKPTLRLTLSIPSILPLRFHSPLTVFTGPVLSERRQRLDALPLPVRAALDTKRHRNGIYISLGTFVRIDASQVNKLVEAFLPTIQDDWTVIWALSSKKQAEITTENAKLIAAVAPNFIIEPWVETPAVLSHPGVKLFVSHCGANGYHEALASGVPILGLPIAGDQPYNCAAAEKNVGNVFCFALEQTSALTLRRFAREVLNKPNSNPQTRRARTMKAAVEKAYNGMENAIKWLETAAAVKGDFRFLETPPEKWGVLRGYNLDVIISIAALAIVLIVGFSTMLTKSRLRAASPRLRTSQKRTKFHRQTKQKF